MLTYMCISIYMIVFVCTARQIHAYIRIYTQMQEYMPICIVLLHFVVMDRFRQPTTPVNVLH